MTWLKLIKSCFVCFSLAARGPCVRVCVCSVYLHTPGYSTSLHVYCPGDVLQMYAGMDELAVNSFK